MSEHKRNALDKESLIRYLRNIKLIATENITLENEQEALDLLRYIIKTYTPSGRESKLVKFYKSYLEARGFELLGSKVGNVLAKKGHGHPILLFSSHLDTVPPELEFKEDNTRIFGRGAVDCKSVWSAMLYSVANYDWENLFKKNNGNGTILILGVVQEENDTIGIQDFLDKKMECDAIIFGEPTLIDRICYAYRGRVWIETQCVSNNIGHASSSWNYPNPIEDTFKFINNLRKEIESISTNFKKNQTEEKAESHFNEITYTLTKIHGGENSNTTPKICKSEIDIRIPPFISPEKIKESALRISERIATESDKMGETDKRSASQVSFKVNFKSLIPGIETQPNNLLINSLRWAIYQVIKKKGVLLKKTGTTFFNILAEHYGKDVPIVVYGCGDPRLEHTQNEWIEKKEYLDNIKIFLKFIPKFYALYNRKFL
ncbi:MAG: M20/M25/M40 family metallo-hydrolase [Promethearchaeota archaeon]